MNEANAIVGRSVVASDGRPLGTATCVYYDVVTGRPAWLGLHVGGKQRLAPIDAAYDGPNWIQVAHDAQAVTSSPSVEAETIDASTERTLYDHYALAYENPDAEHVRHEEELAVEKEAVDRGRVRLRKWVEKEPVAFTVTLRREIARVVRERVDEPVPSHDFADATIEIPFHAEEPVVRKHAVARERIAVDKQTYVEREQIVDTVRKERIAVEHEGETS